MNVNVDSFVFSLGCLLLLGCEFFCQFSFCSDGMLLVLNVFCMQSIFLVFSPICLVFLKLVVVYFVEVVRISFISS